MDARWGFCHVRVQTWLPMSVHVCVNGLDCLSRPMDRVGMGYRRRENCFGWVEDVERAPSLLDEHLRTDCGGALEPLLKRSHPAYASILGLFEGEVTSNLRERTEGMRIKHRVNANAIKMYDKQGSVLRVDNDHQGS